MACGCKSDNSVGNEVNEVNGVSNNANKGVIVRFLLFLASLLFIPFVVVITVWILFKNIVLNKSADLTPILKGLALNAMRPNKEYDDSVYDEYDGELDELEVVDLVNS